jgi:very-short-patch-repair endonuclease
MRTGPLSAEHKRKISKTVSAYLIGKKLSEQTKQKKSESMRKFWANKLNVSKMLNSRNIGNSMRGKSYEELYGTDKANTLKNIRSVALLGKPSKLAGKTYKDIYGSDAENQVAKRNKPEYIAKRVKSNIKTRPEIKTELLLNSICPNQFIYTGLGQFTIERFIPDFVDVKNKKVIEVYGDYWHGTNKARKHDAYRAIVYKRNNYKLCIIWEHELKDEDAVKVKLTKFVHGNVTIGNLVSKTK